MDPKTASATSQPAVPTSPAPSATSSALPQVQNAMPAAQTLQATPPTGGPKNNHKMLFIVLGIFLTFVVLLGGAGATLAAVAYDKISLGNEQWEQNIEHFVMGMPFMPKTPTYILESSAIAHGKHSKHAFNLSLSAQSDDAAAATIGMNNFDIEAKGDIDYTDPKNVMFSINASVTKDFNMDIRKKDPIVYFKINKIPALLYSFAQLDQAKAEPILTQWVQYDTSTLDTEARRALDEEVSEDEGSSLTDQYLENTLNDMLSQTILEKMRVSEEDVDGVRAHLFDLEADDQTIDDLVERMNNRAAGRDENVRTLRTGVNDVKPSAYIKNLKLKVWVEKDSYLVRKITTTFDYDQNGLYNYEGDALPSQVLGISTDVLGIEDMLFGSGIGAASKQPVYKIATVVGLSDFGKSINVETPASSKKIEELVNELMGAMGYGDTGGPGELTMRSRDAARLTDLANVQQAINVAVQESTENGPGILCSVSKRYPCSGNSATGTREANGGGWIKANLQQQRSVSVPTLPVDPVNSTEYHYSYCANGGNWEINTVLESEQQKPKMENDGGDDDTKYEVGSDLTLMNKSAMCRY